MKKKNAWVYAWGVKIPTVLERRQSLDSNPNRRQHTTPKEEGFNDINKSIWLIYAGSTCTGLYQRHGRGTNAVSNTGWKIKSQDINRFYSYQLNEGESLCRKESECISAMVHLQDKYKELGVSCINRQDWNRNEVDLDCYFEGEQFLKNNLYNEVKQQQDVINDKLKLLGLAA